MAITKKTGTKRSMKKIEGILILIAVLVSSCSLEYKQSLIIESKKMKSVKLEPLTDQDFSNVEENEELTKIEVVEGTPFTVVKVDDQYFLALGKYRLSELLDSEEEAKEEINDLSWNRLLSVMYAVANEVYRDHEEQRGRIIDKAREEVAAEGGINESEKDDIRKKNKN